MGMARQAERANGDSRRSTNNPALPCEIIAANTQPKWVPIDPG
jgi:hypothetical protein